MARPKSFDVDQALNAATLLFAEKGYQGTSLRDLLRGMGISRQSLYDTYGGKWPLYLSALDRYMAGRQAAVVGCLEGRGLDGVEALVDFVLDGLARTAPEQVCFVVTAGVEWGGANEEINERVGRFWDVVARSAAESFERAARSGQLEAEVDVDRAARFLVQQLVGVHVLARQGSPVDDLGPLMTAAIRGVAEGRIPLQGRPHHG